MTAVANPATFVDLFQDATKDPFSTLAAAAKHTAYKKIYAHYNVDSDTGVVLEAASILKEITHLFEGEPIGRIAFFLQTDDGNQLKIVHKLCKYQPRVSVTTSNVRREFVYLREV